MAWDANCYTRRAEPRFACARGLVLAGGQSQAPGHAGPPVLTGLAFAGSAPHDADGNGAPDTYRTGDAIAVAATFTEAVEVDTADGTPALALVVGTTERTAAYASGTGTDTLTFSYTVRAGETDTDGVSVPADAIALNGATLADEAGNAVVALAHAALAPDPARTVDGSTVPARVTGIAFTGAAPRDADGDETGDTYRMGDAIAVEAAFDRTVTVTGAPAVALELGDATVQAFYTGGSGTTTLAFAYTVDEDDEDTDGVSVPADPIALGSGRIGDAAGTAALAHGGLAADAARRVDAVAPRIAASGSEVNRGSLNDGAFGAGDVVRLTIAFTEAVRVTGSPVLRLAVADGGTTRHAQAGYAGRAGAGALVFEHEVVAADVGTGTVSAAEDRAQWALGGATVTDAAGNAAVRVAPEGTVAAFTLRGGEQGGTGADTAGPLVAGVAFAGAAPRDADDNGVPETYGAGDAVAVAVTYSEAVEVDTAGGTPALALLVGTTERAASYDSGSGTETLVFVYTVQAGETDADGVSMPAGAIALNGGTLADAAGNDAALAHDALAPDAARTVDGTAAPAAVTGIAFGGVAPRDADRDGAGDTYRKDDAVEIEVTFDRAVTVTGTPVLALAVGDETVQAAYAGGTGTATLTFSYTVGADDEDTDGVSVPADPIALAGGGIGDAAGTATLAHDGLAADASRRVDAVAPRLSGDIAVNAPPQSPGGHPTFFRGDVIRLTARFTEAVTVSGTPSVALTIGPLYLFAAYQGKAGTDTLVFEHEVASRDVDTDGLAYSPHVQASGSVIRDAAGNAYTEPLRRGRTTGPRVDGSQDGAGMQDLAPALRSVAFDGAAPRDANDDSTPETYWQGDAIAVAVTFTEAVEVDTASGTPALALRVGANVRAASYASGTGTDTLTFSYTVGEDDEDRDGVSVPAGAIALNGGTLADAAGNAAALAHDGLAPDGSRRVDGRPARVTGLGFAGTAPLDADDDAVPDSYGRGDAIEVAVTFDRAVTVTGAPSLALAVGSATVQAAYAGGTGTATLTFSYPVRAGDADTDGVSVPAGAIALNGGTLADAAGNAAALAHGAIAPDAARRVDGTAAPAALTGIGFAGAAPRDADRDGRGDTYRTEDVIVVEAAFDRAVAVTGMPTLALGMGDGTAQAAYAGGTGTATLTFSYPVVSGDAAADGVSVPADPIALGSGRIGDAAGVAVLAHGGLTADAARRVDGVAPRLSGEIFYRIPPPSPFWFFRGDVIQFHATFSEPVFVTSGTPRVPLFFGSGNVWAEQHREHAVHADYAGKAAHSRLVFEYEVQAGDADSDGLAHPNRVALNGGTIHDAAGNAHVETAREGVADPRSWRVDGSQERERRDRVAPALRGLAFSGPAPHDGDGDGAPDTYRTRDAIELAAAFTEAVEVDTAGGTPTLVLVVGGAERAASYASGTGTETLVFRYAVQAGETDSDGVSVPAGAIAPNGATLADAAGNDAALAYDALAPDAARKVDGSTTPAALRSLAFTGSAPHDADGDGAGDTYRAGDAIAVEAAFDRAVAVTGAPTVALELGDATVQASYAGGSGTATLAFAYTVEAGDEDADGVSVPADPIGLGSGRIGDAAGTTALAHDGLAPDPARRVDAVAPRLSGDISVNVPPQSPGGHPTFFSGDVIRLSARFTEAVTVSGTPDIHLSIGRGSQPAVYQGKAGADTLVFEYEVQLAWPSSTPTASPSGTAWS